jgi:tripartite-type tricarboxylate transporter receptor subunit TctC
MNTLIRATGLVAALLLAATGPSIAQGNWPAEKPITMIVPFPPGGVADTVARPVAEALGKALNQTVVVENRAGAGGATGIGAASRAVADGYTVLLSLSSISILPQADVILGRKPQFTLNQFKPIARFTADPTVLVVRGDAPWKTLGRIRKPMRRRSRAPTTTAARATTAPCTCRWRCSRPARASA